VAAVLASSWAFWAADNTWQNVIGGATTVLFCLIDLWLLRRFGLLATVAALLTDASIEYTMPIELRSWYGGRSLVALAIPALVATGATWVIVSAGRRPASQAGTAAASSLTRESPYRSSALASPQSGSELRANRNLIGQGSTTISSSVCTIRSE
jgi:hypothetical protein